MGERRERGQHQRRAPKRGSTEYKDGGGTARQPAGTLEYSGVKAWRAKRPQHEQVPVLHVPCSAGTTLKRQRARRLAHSGRPARQHMDWTAPPAYIIQSTNRTAHRPRQLATVRTSVPVPSALAALGRAARLYCAWRMWQRRRRGTYSPGTKPGWLQGRGAASVDVLRLGDTAPLPLTLDFTLYHAHVVIETRLTVQGRARAGSSGQVELVNDYGDYGPMARQQRSHEATAAATTEVTQQQCQWPRNGGRGTSRLERLC
ncbi:hypothetical protein G7046_g1164 [Stylonectria norvegica]|nr:hypothetical protein G7046_g1164 [Stylonectria norvegica]